MRADISTYTCSSCGEKFPVSTAATYYHTGASPITTPFADRDLLRIPTRHAWCKDCNRVCLVEDILPLRDMENAYGAARKGQAVEYPVDTTGYDAVSASTLVKQYLRWRMERRRPARALCCGRTNYQFMDVAQPLLMHEGCENGHINGPSFWIGSSNSRRPGVYSAANIAVYDTEGELRARLTWYKEDDETWTIEPASYPPAPAED
jgi:hypothetical protein